MTTAATGSVTSAVQVFTGSKLTLGGNMALGGNFDMEYAGSTLDMGGHALSANTIYFGLNQAGLVTIVNPGQITAATLNVGNGCLATLPAGSAVASLNLATSGQLTTAATGSVTSAVQVFTGSKLTLGGNMALGGNFDMEYAGSTLDMGSHALSASTINFGFNQPGLVTVVNPGQITAATLNVGNGCLATLPAGSAVASLNLATSGQLTTAATGSVTSAVQVFTGSKLTLGGNMALGGNFDMEYAGSTLDMGSHALSASTINFGFNQAGTVTLDNPGQITAANLNVGNGCLATVPAGGDVISGEITVSGSSTLTLLQGGGSTGLTLEGESLGSLNLSGTDAFALDLSSQPGWIFRWQDAGGSNWDNTLAGLIAGGQVVVNAPNGYTIYDQSGYTYVGNAVPEPGAIALLLAGSLALVPVIRQRMKKEN